MIAKLPARNTYNEYVPRHRIDANEPPGDYAKSLEEFLSGGFGNDKTVSSNERLDTLEIINNAARTINELVTRNEGLRQGADETIALLKNDLRSEKDRAERFRSDLEASQIKLSNTIAGNEQRFRDSTAERQDLSDRLQKVEEELDVANQWLEYMSANVRSQLSDTIRKAEQFLTVK